MAYIDEAGSDSLKNLMPFHKNGASEWFVLAAAVVRIENEERVDKWLSDCLKLIKAPQRKDIHFKDLQGFKKGLVCAEAAKLPARYFVVMSNKKNIENYSNAKLPPSKTWLYWFMTRMLMERITAFCSAWSARTNARNRKLEVIFSKRDDFNYADVIDYFIRLYHQTNNNTLFLDFKVEWDVVDFFDIYALRHHQRAGLQLADVVASSFFQSVTPKNGKCDTSYAAQLKNRMHRRRDGRGGVVFLGNGVKPMPAICEMKLPEEQRSIFTIYGYEGAW